MGQQVLDNPKSFTECMRLIDESIIGLSITSQFIKLPQLDLILSNQYKLQEQLSLDFRSFIMNEINKLESFCIVLGAEHIYEISIIKKEAKEVMPQTPKKWWNIFK